MARIWSVYDREVRLVVGVTDRPGTFNFTKLVRDDVEPVECEFATLQCYDVKAEPELLNILFASVDLEAFLDSLVARGFKVIEGRPQPSKFARL